MQNDNNRWYNVHTDNQGVKMKTWTRTEIDKLLTRSDAAVERAMVRLFNADAFHERDVEAGTHFAQWVSGMNGRSKVVYPPKSLSHDRSIRRFRKMCLRGETPVDRARRIALSHSQFLTDVVYGLNVQEIKYVWKEYRETIIDKINNGL